MRGKMKHMNLKKICFINVTGINGRPADIIELTKIRNYLLDDKNVDRNTITLIGNFSLDRRLFEIPEGYKLVVGNQYPILENCKCSKNKNTRRRKNATTKR